VCAAQVPHLNQLQRTFEKQGLTVVGVTGESVEDTEPWIEQHKAEFAYGYSPGLLAFFGVTSLPYAVLVNSQGTIVWKGHPAALGEDWIKIAVRGSIQEPLYAWPPAAAAAKEALVRRRYAPALQAAKDLDPRYAKMIKRRMAHLVGSMERATKRKDYLLAKELALRVFRQCEGLPQQETARERLRELKASPEISRLIEAQLQLRNLVQRAERTRERAAAQKLLQEIKRLMLQHPKDVVGQHARREALVLEDLIKSMP